jgi:hypothetical protein
MRSWSGLSGDHAARPVTRWMPRDEMHSMRTGRSSTRSIPGGTRTESERRISSSLSASTTAGSPPIWASSTVT